MSTPANDSTSSRQSDPLSRPSSPSVSHLEISTSPDDFPLPVYPFAAVPETALERATTSDSSLATSNPAPSSVNTEISSRTDDEEDTTSKRPTSQALDGSGPSQSPLAPPDPDESPLHRAPTLDTLPPPVLQLVGRQRTDTSDQPQERLFARVDSIWSIPASWTGSLRSHIPRENLGQNTIQLTALFFAVISTSYLSYRSYVLAVWQTKHDFYDWCRGQSLNQRTDLCNATLSVELGGPPYMQGLSTRSIGTRKADGKWQWIILSWDIFIGFVVLACAICVLRLARRNKRQPSRFDDVHVRIEPDYRQGKHKSGGLFQTQVQKSPFSGPEFGMRRRIIQSIPGKPCDEWDEHGGRQGSQSNDDLFKPRLWKDGDCFSSFSEDGTLSDKEITGSKDSLKQSKVRRLTQIGDALKGNTDNDELVRWPSGSTVGTLRRKVHQRYPWLLYLFHNNQSDEDLKPPLTAFGTDTKDDIDAGTHEYSPRGVERTHVVLSGFVAMGVAQSGAVLAASSCGTMGQEILRILEQQVDRKAHTLFRVPSNELQLFRASSKESGLFRVPSKDSSQFRVASKDLRLPSAGDGMSMVGDSVVPVAIL